MANSGVAIDAERLRLARLRKGWTLREVSQRCMEIGTPVHHGNLSAYERGTIRPQPRTLVALVQALGLTVDDLVIPVRGSAA